MKSRTNAQQELMRQQIIEEERTQILSSPATSFKVSKSSPRSINYISINDPNKSLPNRELTQKPLITLPHTFVMDSQITKRQKSSSYSSTSCISQAKIESFSPTTKSPMDLSFSNLGNDDVLDWNQIEPSITTTSEISQDLLDEMTRGQHETIVESYMETGTEENDSLQDDQSVSSMKPSTSCPANITHPILFTHGHTVIFSQNNTTGQKAISNTTPVSAIVEDQKLQWMRDRSKKDCHNRIERKRRDYINNQIQELGQLLPEKLFLSTESKRNKGGILKNSVIYIQQLQHMANCVQHLQKEAQISEHIISSSYKRQQYLEGVLSQNGIHFDEADNIKAALQEWFAIHQSNSQLLQSVNSIKASWSTENDSGDKLQGGGNSYEDCSVKGDDLSSENIIISNPVGKAQSSSASVTNYHSPLNTSNQSNNNNSRSRTTSASNINIVSLNSPQSRPSQIYGTSQPFTKSGVRLYDSGVTKSCVTDSPVLSSILIGSSGSKTTQDSTNKPSLFTGLSNSVPDGSRAINIDNSNTAERYFLIPIPKSKSILVTQDPKNSRGINKMDTGGPILDDGVLTRGLSTLPDSPLPRITIVKSFSLKHGDSLQDCVDLSPNHNNEIEDSIMDEFEFDSITNE